MSTSTGLTHEGDFVNGAFMALPERMARVMVAAAQGGGDEEGDGDGSSSADAPIFAAAASTLPEVVIECYLPQQPGEADEADAEEEVKVEAETEPKGEGEGEGEVEEDGQGKPKQPAGPAVAVGESGRRVAAMLVASAPAAGTGADAEAKWLEELPEDSGDLLGE